MASSCGLLEKVLPRDVRRSFCPGSDRLKKEAWWRPWCTRWIGVFAKFLEKLRKQRGGVWTSCFPSGILYDIMAGRTIFSSPKIQCFALAVLSLCKLLRQSEAWASHKYGLGPLVFIGEKSRRGVQV